MSNLTTLDQNDQPPDDNRPPTRSVPLPSRDQVTAIQVGTLLHATAMLSPFLIQSDDYDGERSVKPQKSEAGIAAENSVVKILARLDTIIDDADRWTLGTQRSLESDLSAVYKGHLALISEQRAGVTAVNSPHRYAGIKLARVDGGLWAAVLGKPGSGDCIVGIGDSPADACADFDRIFSGKQTEKSNEPTESELPVEPETSSDAASKKAPKRPMGRNRKPPRPDGEIL